MTHQTKMFKTDLRYSQILFSSDYIVGYKTYGLNLGIIGAGLFVCRTNMNDAVKFSFFPKNEIIILI